MLDKKLITVACAAGILASGACFLPPLPERAPPPITLDLQGVHKIEVRLTDASQIHKLDTKGLAFLIAYRINDLGRRERVTAFTPNFNAGTSGPADAVLEITIVRLVATPRSASGDGASRFWDLDIGWNAVLTKPDGKVVWQMRDGNDQISHRAKGPFLDDPNAGFWLNHALAKRIDQEMLYAH